MSNIKVLSKVRTTVSFAENSVELSCLKAYVHDFFYALLMSNISSAELATNSHTLLKRIRDFQV